MSRVPGDAIHAAAVAMAQVETGPDGTQPNDVDILLARVALEAAAPHMLARAYDRGFTDCTREWVTQREDPSHPITRNNPYGSEA